MNLLPLSGTARALVAHGKGLLAMDESTGTCNQRFASLGLAPTLALRQSWRNVLISAPGLSTCISGVILVDETLRQTGADGRPFAQQVLDAGMLIGIKVDTGATDLAAHSGEKVTQGLDGLRERLLDAVALGARFAKWRAVLTVAGATLPSVACIDANAHALARYAALCQEAGLVPVIEPEILMDGTHDLARCQALTEAVLRSVFDQLARQGVWLEALILKTHMVIAGSGCRIQNTAVEVAEATVQALSRVVPAAVPGVVFLSGGQSGPQACSRLNAMHVHYESSSAQMAFIPTLVARKPLPWPLSFSFGRALQHPALEIWGGIAGHRQAAQEALLHRAQCSCAALTGSYSAAMETP